MRRKFRHRRRGANVDINLAAMLDMAFQLLAFFILTFRPAPIESHLQLRMPPPVALSNVAQIADPSSASQSDSKLVLPALDLYVLGNRDGELVQVDFGNRKLPVFQGSLNEDNLRVLSQRLETMFDPKSGAFDRVQLVVDGRLPYDNVMRILDVCTRQKMADGERLTQVSFVDLPPSQWLEAGEPP
jgi:biopolymer transport protein ExbD